MVKKPNKFSIIVAVDQATGYVNGREIPWSFKEDWKHFKKVTHDQACVMGRKTYEDIAERRMARNPNFDTLLTDRRCYVVSRTMKEAQGATVVRGLFHVPEKEVIVLGGYRLWIEAFPYVDEVYMTIVPGKYETTRKFPVELLNKFRIVEGRQEELEEGTIYFVHYLRKGKLSFKKRLEE